MACKQHLNPRCVFCCRGPAPKVPGVPTESCLESSIKKVNPHFIYDCVFSRAKNLDYKGVAKDAAALVKLLEASDASGP